MAIAHRFVQEGASALLCARKANNLPSLLRTFERQRS
jgi:hypothetical protein